MTKTERAKRAAAGLESNEAFRTLVRVGYAANGVLHVLIGVLALQVAFGGNASADQSGALGAIAGSPGGVVLLWVIAVGTAALGLFEVLELSLIRARTHDAWAERAKLLGKAVAYLVIGGLAATVALGGSSGGGGAQSLSSRVLQLPGGVVILLVVALAVAGIGIYLIAQGVRQKFLDDLTTPNPRLRTATTVVGTAGYAAKGLAIVIVGGFLGFAAVTSDPSRAEGLDGALTSLTTLPLGQVMLVIVALGLVLFGGYCFLRAKYAKL